MLSETRDGYAVSKISSYIAFVQTTNGLERQHEELNIHIYAAIAAAASVTC